MDYYLVMGFSGFRCDESISTQRLQPQTLFYHFQVLLQQKTPIDQLLLL